MSQIKRMEIENEELRRENKRLRTLSEELLYQQMNPPMVMVQPKDVVAAHEELKKEHSKFKRLFGRFYRKVKDND